MEGCDEVGGDEGFDGAWADSGMSTVFMGRDVGIGIDRFDPVMLQQVGKAESVWDNFSMLHGHWADRHGGGGDPRENSNRPERDPATESRIDELRREAEDHHQRACDAGAEAARSAYNGQFGDTAANVAEGFREDVAAARCDAEANRLANRGE